MLSAQVEDYLEALPELLQVYPQHWEELALDREQPEARLDPDYDRYERLYASGELLLVTLRDRGELAGYFIGVISPGLHYKSCLTCLLDIFYVLPKFRGRHGGVRLFRAVKRELERRGVNRWFVGSKIHRDASRLFQVLGFKPVETYYSMWLGK